ncbi:MAG TPA: lasso peptide biosynthesis B2 protein [Candidatus Saccharimonadales bacterium]|nr:lasso peptide biosynthesis B2 protein [Candidatus Saccharimonadales bacterium]
MTVNMLPPDSSGSGLSLGYKVLGFLSLLLAVTSLRVLSLATLVTTLIKVKPDRAASSRQAEDYIRAIQWAGNFYFGRVACLERAVGVAILAAMVRRRVTSCIGARFRPNEFHAWTEVDGTPVMEIESADWPYQAAVRF